MQYTIQTIDQLKPLLQGFRRKAGLTQTAMAEKLGVTQQNYAQLESNLGSASVERLYKVLRLLNVQLVFDERESTSEESDEISSQPASVTRDQALSLTQSKKAPAKVIKRNDTTKW
ncbi:helix-turn-helix domain-containing protein [Pseudoduganella sp. R-43]|uniref:helix-turn-helix domain-containing protein n=1 Tax=unclassified Pseudoduganella TaxID=2637179 RepID=UPI003CF690F7